jgi:hypothetical protein
VSGPNVKLPAGLLSGDVPREVIIGKPTQRCVPVETTLGRVATRPAHTCYAIDHSGVPDSNTVVIDNAAGNNQTLTVKRSDRLCIDDTVEGSPSTVTLP